MELAAALRYLDQHTNLEATAGRAEGLSLDRMRALVGVLGDPQTAYPVIHITGTNGKGSVARMVTELLRASGLSVGTYTSPHLERINERIAWDGEPIDDSRLAEAITAVSEVEPLAGVTPSYFEILTAAAFRYFAEVAVDVAVVEVGMLGRYDATNVADATVAVLTNVGHDHTDGVGAWRAAIAEEKVGIVKPGCTFVLGETDPELRPIFAATGSVRDLGPRRGFRLRIVESGHRWTPRSAPNPFGADRRRVRPAAREPPGRQCRHRPGSRRGLFGCQLDGGIVGLVSSSAAGPNTLSVSPEGVRSRTRRPPMARFDDSQSKSFAADPRSRTLPVVAKIGLSSGSVSPRGNVQPSLTIPTFSSAIGRSPRADAVGVVVADVRQHCDRRVGDVRFTSSPPEHPYLDHCDIHRRPRRSTGTQPR